MIDRETRLKYESVKVAARINGKDLLEALDRAALIWTPERTKQSLELRAQSVESLPIQHLLPEGVRVENATLTDLRRGIAAWLRRGN